MRMQMSMVRLLEGLGGKVHRRQSTKNSKHIRETEARKIYARENRQAKMFTEGL